jgi:hypothetical protein
LATSTAWVYSQFQQIEVDTSAAGKQWLHALYLLYQHLLVDSGSVDAGRWVLVDASHVDWTDKNLVVDNSWFVVRCGTGESPWEVKFQATNVAALDESPSTTYSLMATLSPAGGWQSKGAGNGGFSGTSVPSGTVLFGGGALSGTVLQTCHSDRDTLLVATSLDGSYEVGGYIGKYNTDLPVLYPQLALGGWDGTGSSDGFHRGTAGCFGIFPASSYVLNHQNLANTVSVRSPGWLTTGTQPNPWTAAYDYTPLDIVISNAYLGTLRGVCATAAPNNSRIDNRRKLVVTRDSIDDISVAIKNNGVAAP